MLTFAKMTEAHISRSNRWHDGDFRNWSVSDWSNAMAGEAGEVCNAVKKLRRLQDQIASINEADRQIDTLAQAKAKIGEEIADTISYLVVLAAHCEIDIEAAFIEKFNSVSEKYGFPERL